METGPCADVHPLARGRKEGHWRTWGERLVRALWAMPGLRSLEIEDFQYYVGIPDTELFLVALAGLQGPHQIKGLMASTFHFHEAVSVSERRYAFQSRFTTKTPASMTSLNSDRSLDIVHKYCPQLQEEEGRGVAQAGSADDGERLCGAHPSHGAALPEERRGG